jgi:Ca2+-binding RTX toxin-like protein
MAVIRGTQGRDTLVGTLSDDTIIGLGGNDRILADFTVFDSVGGDDVVDGGSGNDEIFTFGGEDVVNSGSGNDTTTMSKAAGTWISCLGKPATMSFEVVKMTTTFAAAPAATE